MNAMMRRTPASSPEPECAGCRQEHAGRKNLFTNKILQTSEPALGMGEVGPCPGPCAWPRASEPLCENGGFCHVHFIYCKLLPDANIMTMKWSNLKSSAASVVCRLI